MASLEHEQLFGLPFQVCFLLDIILHHASDDQRKTEKGAEITCPAMRVSPPEPPSESVPNNQESKQVESADSNADNCVHELPFAPPEPEVAPSEDLDQGEVGPAKSVQNAVYPLGNETEHFFFHFEATSIF